MRKLQLYVLEIANVKFPVIIGKSGSEDYMRKKLLFLITFHLLFTALPTFQQPETKCRV